MRDKTGTASRKSPPIHGGSISYIVPGEKKWTQGA
jgi:hypothetical protein